MNKQEIKNILISIRTQENDTLINNLLGKIDNVWAITSDSHRESW